MCRVKNIVFSFVASLLFIVTVGLLDLIYKNSHNNVSLAETIKEKIIHKKTTKYKFLDEEIAFYIESLSKDLDLDSDLIVAILMVENETFNPYAMNKNKNGTIDVGLFQINDKYLWATFQYTYWKSDIQLDPFNWKHNTFIAIHHIRYLFDHLHEEDKVIMAYNCGINGVRKDKIPKSTKIYLEKVKSNIEYLKTL